MFGNRSNGYFGIILGGLVAVAAVTFVLTGGQFGGKTTVESDNDLPPVIASDTR